MIASLRSNKKQPHHTDSVSVQVPLTPSDVKTVLDALVYGGELEMKQSTEVDTSIEDEKIEDKPITTQSFLYRLAPRTPGFAFLAHIPCTIALASFCLH
ncbi:unnamed protein product [Hydatigera taeniaeformis]|uniref:Skp1_POZ domain-containing protein n=1 Tax=Hydatigena taeniaeformis TaxID=6205 RepID=A0A0R3XCZ4_HYDTA|nr:unnamed protein product [Hydatigera taeniaeformis]